MQEQIKNLIKSILKSENINEIGIDESLLDLGLDSIKTIELVVELEDCFDIEVDQDDLIIDNFTTISKIMELVNRYINV